MDTYVGDHGESYEKRYDTNDANKYLLPVTATQLVGKLVYYGCDEALNTNKLQPRQKFIIIIGGS